MATVHVSLSPFSHVSAQRLKEIFELLIEGEKLPLVELVVKAMEIEMFCKRCRRHSRIKEPTVVCPHCKIEDIQIFVKEELVIDAIEIETNSGHFTSINPPNSYVIFSQIRPNKTDKLREELSL